MNGERLDNDDLKPYLDGFCVPFFTHSDDPISEFKGTIFRLPLRQCGDDPRSLSTETFTFESMQSVMMKMKTKLADNVKFLQNVTRISFYVQDPQSKEAKLLHSVRVERMRSGIKHLVTILFLMNLGGKTMGRGARPSREIPVGGGGVRPRREGLRG